MADVIAGGSRPTTLSSTASPRVGQTSPPDTAARPPAPPRDYRLDILRGLAICLVMLRHTNPLEKFYWAPLPSLNRFFTNEIALPSVPVLLMVSMMLLLPRTSRGLDYMLRRLWRLLLILAVCFVLQVLVCAAALQRWPAIGWHEIWLGGPALPRAGDSVFYFLVNLMLLTALAWPYALLPSKWRTMVGLTVLVITGVIFEALTVTHWGLPYYSPLNFLVYIPLADLALRWRNGLSRGFWLMVAGWVVFACQDMLLRTQVFARPSIVLGSLCLVVAFQRFAIPRVRLLELAGRYSLGLFVVHKWFLWALAALAVGIPVSRHVHYFVPAAVSALTIGLSCLVVALLSRTPARFLMTGGVTGSRPPHDLAGPASGG